jgi:hypothetical protein
MYFKLNLEWYTKEKDSYISNNFTQLVLVFGDVNSKDDSSNKAESYFNWYCLSKNSALKKSTYQNNNNQLIIDGLNERIDSNYFYLKKLFSFIICSADSIFLFIIITSIFLGFSLLFIGCIKFYKHEIIINQTDDYASVSNQNEICCECFSQFKDKSKHKDRLSIQSFEIYKKKNSPETIAPYIYDDLPMFVYNALKPLAPPIPSSPPPSLIRNTIFIPKRSDSTISDRYELVPFNMNDHYVKKNNLYTEYFV